MSMDPNKWIPFEKLSLEARQRIETVYPYLKLEHCVFQEKASGVFMKQANSVKIEKLLDSQPRSMPRPPPPAATATPATTRGRRSAS